MSEEQEVDPNATVTAQDLENVAEVIIKVVEQRFEKLEARIETVEKLHASLAVAYVELGSSVEAIITEIMSPRSEEEREKFRREMNERFQQTLNMMQEVTSESVRKNPQATIDDALAKMAAERQDSST